MIANFFREKLQKINCLFFLFKNIQSDLLWRNHDVISNAIPNTFLFFKN